MKSLEEIKQYIVDKTDEPVVLFSDYETAFLGLSNDNRAIYSYAGMIEYLIEKDNMSYEEAVEWIEYNTLGSYIENGPIVLMDEMG